MEHLSLAQDRYTKEILQLNFSAEQTLVMTKDQLRANLESHGIVGFSEQDFEALVSKLVDPSGEMNPVQRYARGHLFPLFSDRTKLEE